MNLFRFLLPMILMVVGGCGALDEPACLPAVTGYVGTEHNKVMCFYCPGYDWYKGCPTRGDQSVSRCSFDTQTGCQAGLDCLPRALQADPGVTACMLQGTPAFQIGGLPSGNVECAREKGGNNLLLIMVLNQGEFSACPPSARSVRVVEPRATITVWRGGAATKSISSPLAGGVWHDF